MLLKDIQQHREAEKKYISKIQNAEDQISELKGKLEEKDQAINNSSDSGWGACAMGFFSRMARAITKNNGTHSFLCFKEYCTKKNSLVCMIAW